MNTEVDTKKQTVEELTPEWFEIQKATFYAVSDATPEEKAIYFRGQQYLSLLEKVMAKPLMVDEVEILKHYAGDPQCRTCHGTLRVGINRIPDKMLGSFYQLQLCHCAKQIDSEYLKLEKAITQSLLKQTEAINFLMDKLTEQNKIHSTNTYLLDSALKQIDRHTFGYWIEWVYRYFELKLLFRKTIKEAKKILATNESTEGVSQPTQQG